MKKKLIPIEDFLTDASYLAITGTSHFNNNSTFTLADHTAVYNELFNQYGGRAVLVRGEQTAASVFQSLFEGWKNRRKDDIASLLDAWQMKYNPIENYDATETKTGTETGVETPEDRVKTITQTPDNWKQTETQTPTNWKEVQTPTNWTTESKENKQGSEGAPDYTSAGKSKIVPFGSTESVLVNENETEVSSENTVTQSGTYSTERQGEYKTETSHTGKFETTEGIEGTITNEMTYNTEFRRHGNIGVASAPDLMLKDLQARSIDFVHRFIFEFITEYTVYA